jgi:hypothetical protein
MLEKPCPYHRGPVKHTLKECVKIKRYFSRGAQGKGDPGKRPEEEKGDGKEKDDDFPIVNNCFMIFGGPAAYDSRCQHKLECQEVYATEPIMPAFLDWSRSAITFNHDDHPDHVPQPGWYPLVIDPIIGNMWLTKVLMDGGSGLNIMYAETLDAMEINRTQLCNRTDQLYEIK